MYTEITDTKKWMGPHGAVLYDGACGFCSRWAGFWNGVLARHGFTLLPLQTPGLDAALGLPPGELLRDLRVLTPGGGLVSGAEAYLHVARHIVWAWPLYALCSLPGLRGVFHAGYRWFARNRYVIGGRCEVRAADGAPRRRVARIRWVEWLPLALAPVAVWPLRELLPAWAWMWMLVVGLFAGAKWMTWRQARAERAGVPLWRSTAYLVLWPGMDARAFLRRGTLVQAPARSEWLATLVKTILGAALFWLVAARVYPAQPLLAGWLGMLGAILSVHFGLLHVLSLLWRNAGVNARPIMERPARATSLNELWSVRWNTGFRDLVHERVFLPLWRRWGRVGAILGVYLFSGLVHELVISCPARAGYGLPTAYFLLQGLGALFEHSAPGRALGLGQGWPGRLFTLGCAAVPVYWLFHPAFALKVFLPFMRACGALGLAPGGAP